MDWNEPPPVEPAHQGAKGIEDGHFPDPKDMVEALEMLLSTLEMG